MTHSILIQLDETQTNVLIELLKKGLAAVEDERFRASDIEIKQVLTAKELREVLKISSASEKVYCRQGLLKPRYLGRRVYYLWNEVIETLKRNDDTIFPVSKKLRPARRTR